MYINYCIVVEWMDTCIIPVYYTVYINSCIVVEWMDTCIIYSVYKLLYSSRSGWIPVDCPSINREIPSQLEPSVPCDFSEFIAAAADSVLYRHPAGGKCPQSLFSIQSKTFGNPNDYMDCTQKCKRVPEGVPEGSRMTKTFHKFLCEVCLFTVLICSCKFAF